MCVSFVYFNIEKDSLNQHNINDKNITTKNGGLKKKNYTGNMCGSERVFLKVSNGWQLNIEYLLMTVFRSLYDDLQKVTISIKGNY